MDTPDCAARQPGPGTRGRYGTPYIIAMALAVALLLLLLPGRALASVGDGLALEGQNDWQIVSGQYKGNTASAKKLSSDKNVRIQKNVG